ncbi:MAG: molybdate ABC transporter permease subunit [Anaerolineae bacterium]|jgi:molybdate transport system permease protein|nr:molybdate ABC transporter permease subunit [Anaerolineae bacterium]
MTDWRPLWLSIQTTTLSALIILVVGLSLAYFLARVNFRGKLIVETLVNLPLILPPTVVGYYLLLGLGRGSFLYETIGLRVIFTWQGAAIAGAIAGLPMMIQTARAAIAEVDKEIEDAARVDGASELRVLFTVTIPIARRGILAGFILGTARALGDFGTTLMVAGNIPGRTQTMPLAIYDAVQALRYDDATFMVLILTSLAFSVLWLTYSFMLPRHK